MAKITIPSVSTNFTTASALTSRLKQIEAEFNNRVLYRDNPSGEPNAMQNDLDMDFHRILNLPKPLHPTDPVRLQDVVDGTAGVVEEAPADGKQYGRQSGVWTEIVHPDPPEPPEPTPTGERNIRIAIIGDSTTAQNSLLPDSPIGLLETRLRAQGVLADVIGAGRDGHTFYRAYTDDYIDGKTSVQYTILMEPDIVIVNLGINDVMNRVDGRNYTQILSDVNNVFTALRNGLPDAKILFARQKLWDETPWPTSMSLSAPNKSTIAHFMRKYNFPHYLANSRNSDMLDETIHTQTAVDSGEYRNFVNYCNNRPQVDGIFHVDLWRIHRMGGAGPDGLHLNQGGYQLLAGYFHFGLTNAAADVLPNLWWNDFAVWENPDNLFGRMFNRVGFDYEYKPGLEVDAVRLASGELLNPKSWYLGYALDARVTEVVDNTSDSTVLLTITGAPPYSPIMISVDDAAFQGPIGVTDASGNWSSAISGANIASDPRFSLGSHVLRYRVGASPNYIVSDPVPFTVHTRNTTWTAPSLVNQWQLYDPSTPVGYTKDTFGRVWLRGVLKKANATGVPAMAFNLPVGFRPTTHRIFPTIGNREAAGVEIGVNGNVFLSGTEDGMKLGTTLDGIVFDTQ